MTSDVNTQELSEREAGANALEGYRQMVAELRERLEAVRALCESAQGAAASLGIRPGSARIATGLILGALDGGTR